ncbi:MAG: hypothetical protein U0414_27600 [Polyangiaceae bacterium]
MVARVAVVGVVSLVLGTSGCKSGVDAHPPIATAASASASVEAPLADQGPVFERAARSLDPVDLSDLGLAFGATRLLALADHPSARAAALAALPYASDAELAYAGLVERAKVAKGPDAAAYLDAIAASLERPTRRGEWLAAEPIEASLPALRAIASDATRGEEERALAATVLHRLRDRGFSGADAPALE